MSDIGNDRWVVLVQHSDRLDPQPWPFRFLGPQEDAYAFIRPMFRKDVEVTVRSLEDWFEKTSAQVESDRISCARGEMWASAQLPEEGK